MGDLTRKTLRFTAQGLAMYPGFFLYQAPGLDLAIHAKHHDAVQKSPLGFLKLQAPESS